MIEKGKLKEELQQEIRAKESWRDLYREQLEKNKKLKENNDKLKELVKIPCTSYTRDLEQENRKLKKKIEKLEKELSAVYKAYHTALGVDYVSEEDLYDLDD